ncbi:hypothetical protein [Methylophaga thiooxydans]|uniref:hypothetical protein n=1 Tax=Methylophaga thiooxydans TaxID=392484 RepID=UPI002356FFF3|nr:hypothetical protein [Methylophaga thiooxydans]
MAFSTETKDYFFNLPRPQYPPPSEVLISSLVWELVGSTFKGSDKGIIYKKTDNAKRFDSFQTNPLDNKKKIDQLINVFGKHFSVTEKAHAERAVRILVEDMVGNIPPKANSAALIPLNDSAALMQDVKGMTGLKNPPNFAEIFQSFYSLGGGESSVGLPVYNALKSHKINEKASWLDDFIDSMMPDELKEFRKQIDSNIELGLNSDRKVPVWLLNFDTPYSWFSKTWQNLMSPDWVNAMPRRRWVDWAGCVLRTAIGAGYLFEMNFYYQLVRGLKGNDSAIDIQNRALSVHSPILTWDESSSISSRDVSSKIRKLVERGTASRNLLNDWIRDDEMANFPKPEAYRTSESGLQQWIQETRSWLVTDKQRRQESNTQLNEAISGIASSSANNMYETIRYSLLDRAGHGESDLYALMKKRGSRYTLVEPGHEWFVVISSLTASSPDSRINVRDLVQSLSSLGIDANFKTIIRNIESVGLGRSSHDADDAVEIATAF